MPTPRVSDDELTHDLAAHLGVVTAEAGPYTTSELRGAVVNAVMEDHKLSGTACAANSRLPYSGLVVRACRACEHENMQAVVRCIRM